MVIKTSWSLLKHLLGKPGGSSVKKERKWQYPFGLLKDAIARGGGGGGGGGGGFARKFISQKKLIHFSPFITTS